MLISAFGWVVAVTLLLAGFGHLYRIPELTEAIRAQRLVPTSLATLTAWSAASSELLIGMGMVGEASQSLAMSRSLLGSAAAGLLTTYGIYLWALLRRKEPVPCGCSYQSSLVTSWTLVRCVVLLGAASIWALFSPEAVSSAVNVGALAVGITMALLVWLLPDALRSPRDILWTELRWGMES